MVVKEHYPVTKVHSRIVPAVSESANIHSGKKIEEEIKLTDPAFSEVVTGVVVRDKKSGKSEVEDLDKFFGIK